MPFKKKAILIYCIDPRFERITRQAVERELNCTIELIFTWPGGWPMLPDLFKKLFLEQIMQMFSLNEDWIIILVAHAECGAYWLFRHLRGDEAVRC